MAVNQVNMEKILKKFNSDDDDLLLNKPVKFHAMTIIRQMFVWVMKMLQYKKINISEGIDTNKTSTSKECMPCHYCFSENICYKFESNVCNKYHDVLMTAYELKDIEILNVKGVDYRLFYGVLVEMKLLIF